mgnify:CR=1 FL=1
MPRNLLNLTLINPIWCELPEHSVRNSGTFGAKISVTGANFKNMPPGADFRNISPPFTTWPPTPSNLTPRTLLPVPPPLPTRSLPPYDLLPHPTSYFNTFIPTLPNTAIHTYLHPCIHVYPSLQIHMYSNSLLLECPNTLVYLNTQISVNIQISTLKFSMFAVKYINMTAYFSLFKYKSMQISQNI